MNQTFLGSGFGRCILLIGMLLVGTPAMAAHHQFILNDAAVSSDSLSLPQMPALMIAEADQEDVDPGQAEILESINEADKSEDGKKKCMMVCERWGEDCVINPRTGTRKCRRTCKQLTQECF